VRVKPGFAVLVTPPPVPVIMTVKVPVDAVESALNARLQHWFGGH